MKKTIEKKPLLDICSKLLKYVPGNPIIDVLSTFLIKDNSITVDNQEVRITINIPQEDGKHPFEGVSVCVPARGFTEALRNMTSDRITVKFEENSVSISDPAKRKGVTMASLNSRDFSPPGSASGTLVLLPVPSRYFLPALDKAAMFADPERLDYTRGVGISVRKEQLFVCGGNLTSFYQMRVDIPGISDFTALLTVQGAKALSEIEDTEQITIEKRGDYIFCSNGSVSIQARGLEGKYQDLAPITSQLSEPYSRVSFDDIMSACNICATQKDIKAVNLVEITPLGDSISFYSENEKGDIARQDVQASSEGIGSNGEGEDGIPIGKWVSNPLLKKCLSAIKGEEVFLENKDRAMFIFPTEQAPGVMELTILGHINN